jgi:hypothetical protein
MRMTELRKDPSPHELLERIVRLESRTARLDAKLEALSTEFKKAVKVFADFDKLLMHHCKTHDTQFEDAWARIKNLEFSVFPNLARDIVDLQNIIGDDDSPASKQLDSREKPPWTDKKPPG